MSKQDIIAVIIANSYRGAPVFFLLVQGALFQQPVLNFIMFSLQGLIFVSLSVNSFSTYTKGRRKKHRYFTVRLTVRRVAGGGVSPLADLQKRADRADQSVLFFLASANFYRFNAQNLHFRQILREKLAFFLQI